MPVIVTSIHDPVALAVTCRRLGLDPPKEGTVRLDGREAAGLVVRLQGLYAPVVCDVLSGLVAYHPRDNDHEPYARIMRFVLRFYDVRAALRRGGEGIVAHHRPLTAKPLVGDRLIVSRRVEGCRHDPQTGAFLPDHAAPGAYEVAEVGDDGTLVWLRDEKGAMFVTLLENLNESER